MVWDRHILGRSTRLGHVREEPWFVYVLRCGDGTLYTGIAKDVAARLAQHAAGKGAKYTRGRGPLTLCAKKKCDSKGAALRLELRIKALPKEEKLRRAGSSQRLAAFSRKLINPPVG